MAQKFVYMASGQEVTLDDPDGVYTPQQIKDHWATTFPELSNATWEIKEKNGVKVVTFAKKVGTKGCPPALAAFLSIPPKPVPGAALLAELYADKPANVDDLLDRQAEIQDQLDEARALAHRSEQATKRCLKLKPVSAPKPPTGF